jgi:GT2 family glycosyltransferase
MGSGVGIIVPTFNRAELLRACLESLLNQTVPAERILVVDDGSNDHTAQVVAAFAGRVDYIRKPNGGKARAVNLALESMHTRWIWLFDDDDIALPRAIERRLETLASNPDAEWVYARHVVAIDGGQGELVSRREQSVSPPSPEGLLLRLMTSCFFHLNSCLVSRSVLDAAGPFDTELKAGEDYDVQIRIAGVSAKSVFCPEPVFLFRQHPGVRGDQQSRYAESERSRVFRRYSQRLGLKVRASMPMDAYLVPRRPPACGRESAEAHFNRALVMGNLGCWRDTLEDIEAGLRTAQSADGGDQEASKRLRSLFGNGWMLDSAFDEWPAFLAGAARLRALPGGPVALRHLAWGLWDVAKGHAAPLPARLARLRRAIELATA